MDTLLAQLQLPADWIGPGIAALIVLALGLLWLGAARAARASRTADALAQQLQALAQAQAALAGGLTQVSATQAQTSAETDRKMAESTARTAEVLGALTARLETIDKAQDTITRLSGDVLGLQDILSNKQARGTFGEIQLEGLLRDALPPDSYSLQATLSNRRRADALVHLPRPPGPIVIDSKFPLESYEALIAAEDEPARQRARSALRLALRTHIRAIADRYILPGETAEGALMFLPSEAIYAEMHARLPEVVREGFALRVWVVSPSTCMAVLTTLRAVLRDARVRDAADEIRKALALLTRDVALVQDRAAKVEAHFDKARAEVDALSIAATRAQGRAARLDALEFGETDSQTVSNPPDHRRPQGAEPRSAPMILRP